MALSKASAIFGDTVFGHSPFFHHSLPNFRGANGSATEQYGRLNESSEDDDYCLHALYAMKIGNIATAKSILKAAEDKFSDPVSSLKLLACRTLVIQYQMQLPIFAFDNGLDPVSNRFYMVEGCYIDDNFHYGDEQYQKIADSIKALPNSPALALELFEFRLCRHLLYITIVMSACLSLNKSLPDVPDAVSPREERLRDIKSYLEQAQNLAKHAEALSCAFASKFLDLAQASMEVCQFAQLGKSTFDELRLKYSQDRLMCGHLATMRADSILSPPWASPVTLNIIPVESENACGNGSTWQSVEDDLCLVANAEADELYEQALLEFESVNCQHGIAAIKLRQASVRYGSVITTSHEIPKGFDEILQNTQTILKDVYVMFEGNVIWQSISSLHMIIVAIFDSNYKSAISQSERLAQRIHPLENEPLLRLLTTTILRLGHQQLRLFQRTDSALCMFECAALLSKGQSNFLNFQSRFAQTLLYDEISNHLESRISLERHYEQFFELIQSIDDLHSKNNGSKYSNLKGLKLNLFNTYAPVVDRVLYHTNETKFRSEWVNRLSSLKDDPDMKAYFIESVEDVTKKGAPEGFKSIPNDQIDINERQQNLVRDFETADSERTRLIHAGQLQAADQPLRMFIESVTINSESTTAERSLLCLAQATLGDVNGAKKTLGAIPDADLCNTSTRIRPGPRQAWSRSAFEIEIVHPESPESAIAMCTRCLDWDRGERLFSQIEQADPGFFAISNTQSSYARGYRLGHAGLVLEHTAENHADRIERLLKAFTLLLNAIKSVQRMRNATRNPGSRLGTFSTENVASYFQGLARVCLRLSDLEVQLSQLEDAKVWTRDDDLNDDVSTLRELGFCFLEQGRARALLDSISTATPLSQPSSFSMQHRKQLELVLSAIPIEHRTARETQELQELYEAERAAREAENKDEQRVLAPLMPTTGTLTGPSFRSVTSAIPSQWLSISVTYSKYGAVYFATTNSGIQSARYSQTTELEIQFHAMNVFSCINKTPKEPSREHNSIQTSLHYISEEMLQPFQELIEASSHIVFTVSRPLSAFPFGLLPFNSQSLFLEKFVSQVPSLVAFQQLSTSKPLDPSRVSVIARPSTFKEYQRTWEPPLPMSCIEAVLIKKTLGASELPISSVRVGRKEFFQLLDASNIIQIGTHGNIDDRSPWLSYLSLRERVRVVDLFGGTQKQHRCDLVVFAACLSGLGQTTSGEDVVGFNHMVLGSFAKAFLGALWKVDDLATMLLMVFFYQELQACETGTYLVEVWQTAQKRLYSLDATSAEKELDIMIQALQEEQEKGLKIGRFVRNSEEHLRRRKEELKSLDFKNPFYWASFVLVGNAATKICK